MSPTWAEPVLRPGDRLLTLDPGIAFGSAAHPTTRGCLRLLVERVRPGQRIADVGTGSGILAIAAALFGARPVLALDSDPWACAAATENARRNGVSGVVSVVEAAVGTEFLPGEAPFDGIVANIESGPLVRRLDGFRGGTRRGAWAILGGILEEESAWVEAAAVRAGFSLEATDSEAGWWSGAFLGVGVARNAPDGVSSSILSSEEGCPAPQSGRVQGPGRNRAPGRRGDAMAMRDSASCIFCRIARGEIPADIVHEAERLIAFRDVSPQAPEHILLIPREHVPSVDHLTDPDAVLAGELLIAARDIARRLGVSDSGYRLVTNIGPDGGQSVGHLHLHLLAGRSLSWPPG